MQYHTWFIFHSLEVIVTGKLLNASVVSLVLVWFVV